MHSRIFQVSKVADFVRTSESDYYEDFCGSVADYVDDIVDEEDVRDSIKWLSEILEDAVSFNEDFSVMTIVNKRAYFETLYKRFKKALDDLWCETSQDSFGDGTLGNSMYLLEAAYDDKYGFYINKDGYPITLASFMRGVNDGDVFYMGTVTDYHF